MNTLLNHRDEDEDVDGDERQELHHRQNRNQDREINLGTTMILGIFFALAVLCAAFFGFGYSTGRHSALTAPGPAAASNTSSNTALKPGAGSTANNPYEPQTLSQQPTFQNAPVPTYTAQPTPTRTETPAPPHPRPTPDRVVAPDHVVAVDNPATYVPHAPDPDPTPKPRVLPVAASVPAATTVSLGTGQFMVQVAAVSHQEDGELLVTSLKRRGYSVAIHNEPQDRLLHVQIGPFPNRKEADTMRMRLLGDGFNAIVK